MCACTFASIPTPLLDTVPSICVYKFVFGVECPGCGMTRAISKLLHGYPVQAFRQNYLILFVVPLLAFIGLRSLRMDIRRLSAVQVS